MIELTTELVETTLTEIVDEYGADYVYKPLSVGDCAYVHPGGPSDAEAFVCGCLVGQFYNRIGVMDLEEVGNDSLMNTSMDAKELTSEYVKRGEIVVKDPKAVEMLYAAQYRQDRTDTWGHALRDAITEKNRDDDE